VNFLSLPQSVSERNCLPFICLDFYLSGLDTRVLPVFGLPLIDTLLYSALLCQVPSVQNKVVLLNCRVMGRMCKQPILKLLRGNFNDLLNYDSSNVYLSAANPACSSTLLPCILKTVKTFEQTIKKY